MSYTGFQTNEKKHANRLSCSFQDPDVVSINLLALHFNRVKLLGPGAQIEAQHP
jgi:hypothetical protein